MRLLNFKQIDALANRYATFDPARKISNRHDRKRWVKSIAADMVVAGDAVEADRRGLAASILIEHLTLRDTIAALDGKVLPEPNAWLDALEERVSLELFRPRTLPEIREQILQNLGEWFGPVGAGIPLYGLAEHAAFELGGLEHRVANAIRQQMPEGSQVLDVQLAMPVHGQLEVRYQARLPRAVDHIVIDGAVEF